MIVITTPTGDIGRQVLAKVLAGGQSVRVIARKPSALPPETRGRVEVIEGSHGDASAVDRAFEDADAVFWLVPPNPQAVSLEAAYLEFTRPACAAIQSQGVERVVTVSALGRGTEFADQAGFVTTSLKIEELIAGTGVNFRALVMPSFTDNVLRQVESIQAQGLFFSPIDGDRKLPKYATRDIAAAARQLLFDTSWSGQ